MIDFNRLLEGENRQSTDPDDAEHWYAVYSELVSFKERLLNETKNQLQKIPEVKPELAGYDLPFLEAELGRLRSGLSYWAARRNHGGNQPG
jgi:hypothetical protein